MNKINIPDYCRRIMAVLNKNGFEAFLVGGCVRDNLMGIIPHDYDITTNATPDEMLRIFSGFRVIETGLKHGTITVVIDENNVEITTYRIDGEYDDNRHPKEVSFTRNLKDDLKRRDFTVNAMAYNDEQGLVDLFGGKDDLDNKVIRCVGEPDKRFKEDGLRILRAIRFASVLKFSIAEETAKSIHKNKELLKNISAERIFAEFKRLLCGENMEEILILYKDVIAEFIPEIKPCFDFDQNTKYHCYDVYTHIVKTVSAIECDEKLRLSCFFHDIGKPQVYFTDENGTGHFYGHNKTSFDITEKVLKRLKCDNETLKFVLKSVKYHDTEILPTEKAVKRFINKTSPQFLRSLLKIKRADAAAHAQQYRDREEYIKSVLSVLSKIEQENQCFSLKKLAINGSDLIKLGYKPNEKMGEMLNNLLFAVIDGKVKNEKEELIKFIKRG